jgi:hypothetical protein
VGQVDSDDIAIANEFNDTGPTVAAEGQNAPPKKELAGPLLLERPVIS